MRAWHWRIGIGLLGLLLAAGVWLVVTQAGLAAVIAAIAFARGGQIEYRVLQGRLLDGGTVEGLRYRDERLDLTIESLESRWRWRGFEVRVGETVIRDPVLTLLRRRDQPRIPRVFGLVAIERIVIERPKLTVDGRERPVPERIEGALRMTRAAIEFPTVTASYRATGGFASFGEVRVQGGGVVRGGTPITYQVEARAEAASPNLGAVGAELSAEGAWPQLLVRALTLSGAGGEARFSGAIDLAHELEVALRGEWQDVAVTFADGYEFVSGGSADLRGPWAALRATGVGRMPRTPAGDLELQFDVARRGPSFVVHAIDGRFAPRGEFELHGEYEPGPSAPRLAFDIDWSDLMVTTPSAGVVTSADGSLRITGTTVAYRAWLRGTLDGERVAPLRIDGEGEGNAAGIVFEDFAIEALGGTVQGLARVAFGAEAGVDFDLSGANLDPATRWPKLPGALAFSATGRLARDDSGLRLMVDELRTEGRLRGFPVSGFLRGLSFADARWTIPEFRLHSGASRLSGSGLLDSRAEFNVSLHSPNLGELVPDGRGELRLDASLAGGAGDHTLRVTASGRDLRLFGARAASLSIEGVVNTAPDGPVTATARVSAARWLGQRIDQITLDLTGTGASHTARLLLSGPGRRLEALLAGGVRDVGWNGELSGLSLDGPVLGPWRLAAATRMSISRTDQRLESLCLHGDPGELCAFARRVSGDWQAGVRGQHLPLARVPGPEAYGIDLLGQFDFDLDAAGTADEVERFTLSAALEQGEIVSELLESIAQRIPLEGATLTAGYTAGALTVEGGVYAPAIAERPLDVSVRLENFFWGRGRSDETRLQGRITFDLTELSPLAVFVPQIARPEGLVTIDLEASGTLAQPLFDGRIELHEVSFDLPRFGTRIEDLRLALTGDPSQRLRLDGGMRSGAGSVAITGEVRSGGEHGLALDARINGAAFEVMNTAAARVVVSPDVTVTADRRGLDLAGTLRVPSAQLQPMQMQPATTISEDVIIIADAEQGAPAQTRWLVTADLVVELGDAVQAGGPLFETRLGGRLRVRREPGRATIASGELVIDGDVLAYGARLKIANGRMTFAGGGVTEAALDLRAQREIDALTVGITVSGTTSTPEISLFSSPALPQDRILSYLVMGKPLNELSTTEGSTLLGTAASLGLRNNDIVTGRIARAFGLDQLSLESGATLGDTSVVIGKYLTPKLYLSYGIGLFEPVGTTRLRYEINRSWSVQAEQSEETGVDVFYRIER